MGINVILRPRSATSGGEIREIGGDGAIDNRSEAESALNLLGAGDNVVIVGSEVYDRTRLERIRDGAGSTNPPASGGSGEGLRVGSIRTSENVPPGSRLYLFIDGNPAGDGITLTADRNLPVMIPASTPNGRHEIQYRISRPNLPELRFTRFTEIRPGSRLTTPAPAMGAPSYNSALRGAASLRATAILHTTEAIPSGVTVSVNGQPMGFSGALAQGRNEIPLTNPAMPRAGRGTIRMMNNVAGVAAGTYPVAINVPGEPPVNLSLVIDRPTRSSSRLRAVVPAQGAGAPPTPGVVVVTNQNTTAGSPTTPAPAAPAPAAPATPPAAPSSGGGALPQMPPRN